jgi:hypothetical protein
MFYGLNLRRAARPALRPAKGHQNRLGVGIAATRLPTPVFSVRADSKGLTDTFSVRADSKEVSGRRSGAAHCCRNGNNVNRMAKGSAELIDW